MSKSIIVWVIAIAVIVVIGVGGFLALSNNKSSTDSTQSSTSSSSSNTSNTTQVAATITYSDSGFSPSSTIVKSGDVVEIKNTSSNDLQMESDPHPAHSDDNDLNVGLISAGQSKTFTVTKIGTFGFHNHFNPIDTSTITIQ